jgi:hypothetical protein
VEKVIHPVYASERTGMIWLLEKSQHQMGVDVEKPHAKFEVLGDPLMIHESNSCSSNTMLSKFNLMPSHCKLIGFGCNGCRLVIVNWVADSIVNSIVDAIIDAIIDSVVMWVFVVDIVPPQVQLIIKGFATEIRDFCWIQG